MDSISMGNAGYLFLSSKRLSGTDASGAEEKTMITIQLTNSEVILLRRALQMYARNYQDMKQKEKDPGHKLNLQGYIEAADNLNTKFYELMKEQTA